MPQLWPVAARLGCAGVLIPIPARIMSKQATAPRRDRAFVQGVRFCGIPARGSVRRIMRATRFTVLSPGRLYTNPILRERPRRRVHSAVACKGVLYVCALISDLGAGRCQVAERVRSVGTHGCKGSSAEHWSGSPYDDANRSIRGVGVRPTCSPSGPAPVLLSVRSLPLQSHVQVLVFDASPY